MYLRRRESRIRAPFSSALAEHLTLTAREMGRGSQRSRPTGAMRLLGLLAAVASVSVAQSSVFRCESEDDLDGSACRVDMLPTAALAEMVYER